MRECERWGTARTSYSTFRPHGVGTKTNADLGASAAPGRSAYQHARPSRYLTCPGRRFRSHLARAGESEPSTRPLGIDACRAAPKPFIVDVDFECHGSANETSVPASFELKRPRRPSARTFSFHTLAAGLLNRRREGRRGRRRT